MTNISIKQNPKALNIEKIKSSKSKVTLGFKCNPALKLELAENSKKLGLTLSEYVENLICNYDKISLSEKAALTEIVNAQSKKIKFYENDILTTFYKQYQNQDVNYLNTKNASVSLKITSVEDIYTILINSFKINSKK